MKLSIITINYNDADGLRKTILSVASQTRRNQIEHIIIDDGSTDGSLDVIKEYEDKITYWDHRPNKGIYPTMNEGTENASGEYCLFLNSGDFLHDDHVVENILDELNGVDMIIAKTLFTNSGQTSVVPDQITLKFMYEHSIPHPSSFIRRTLLEKYPYDTSFRIISDWKFFLQTLIIDNASYRLSDVIITDYDCNGISSTRRDICAIERAKVLEEMFPSRVILDYFQFVKGEGYKDTPYDKFFVQLRDFKYSKVIYSLDVILMRVISLFRKGARFVRNYPVKL